MSITEKRLKEIQARLEDSEPGPWYHEPIRGCHELTTVYYCFHNGDTWDRDLVAESTGGNVALIANAPTDLADLLAEVHRLKRRVGLLQSENHRLSEALTTSRHREATARLLPAKMDW